MTIGGVDVTDTPFDFGRDETTVPDAEIVLSNSGAEHRARLSVSRGRASRRPSYRLLDQPRHWFAGSRHFKRASSGPNGSFEVTSLPPGEYFVAAVETSAPLDWQAPDTLDALVPRAARVTAREDAISEMTLGSFGDRLRAS